MDKGIPSGPGTKAASFANRLRPLAGMLLLALAVRLPLAFWPNINHPDEIFQYLEPAWRLLGHDGIISWEWHAGVRSWFLPTLFAGPVAVGDWLAPGGAGTFIAPRVVATLASLSLVITAWFFGARISQLHAIVAAFVAAVWFELVYFAPHTLSEPLATALILPAALLLTGTPSSKRVFIGGGLLALAFVWRFQYAPAIAVLAVATFWKDKRNAGPFILGGLSVLLVAGLLDIAHGTLPFEWLVLNIRENLLHKRAATFGVDPAIAYVYLLFLMWSGATILLLCALWRGWRHSPLLILAAVVNLAFHSLIEHKEYRFIFLTTPLLIIVAALGSADWGMALREKPTWRPWALPIILGGWTIASVGLAGTQPMRDLWLRGVGAARLSAELRSDSELCALAIYSTNWAWLSGRERMVGGLPLYLLDPKDPMAQGGLPGLVQTLRPAFNRVIAPLQLTSELPPDFSAVSCNSDDDGGNICVFARPGGCENAGAAPFEINDVIARINAGVKSASKPQE